MVKRTVLLVSTGLLCPLTVLANGLDGIFEMLFAAVGLILGLIIGALVAVTYASQNPESRLASRVAWAFTLVLMGITFLLSQFFSRGHHLIPDFLAYPYLACILFLAHKKVKTEAGFRQSIFAGLFYGAIAGLLSPLLKLIGFSFFTYLGTSVIIGCCFLWVKKLIAAKPTQPHSFYLAHGVVAGIFMGLLNAFRSLDPEPIIFLLTTLITVVSCALMGAIGAFMAIIVYNSDFSARKPGSG